MAKTNNAMTLMLQVPESTWIVSTDDIRDMWMDYSDLQEVFANIIEARDPEGYAKCICRAVIRFNGKLPQTGFTPAFFPDAGLLMDISWNEVLKTVEAYHTANFITASGGGTVTPLHERVTAIKALRQELTSDIEPRIREWKIYFNNMNIWGSFDSTELSNGGAY